jgi:hypothetical protein
VRLEMKWIGIALMGSLLFSSCALKVFLNDRQTVLEDEAAGEWPDFEKDLLEKSLSSGPTPFPKTDLSAKNSRLYQVLNGELTSDPQNNKPAQVTHK